MNATGHYGAALLLYAPLGSVLLAGSPEAAFAGGALVVSLSTLPDWDRRSSLVGHRGVTHTPVFLALVAGTFAAAGWYVGGSTGHVAAELATVGGGLAVVGVGSHLVADALTPAGVPLLWPLSGRAYSWPVARASSPVANWALLAVGVLATAAVLVVGGPP